MSSGTKEKKQPLVRMDQADKSVLDQLSAKTGESAPRLLHRAVTQLKKDIFFEQMNNAYADLKQDKAAWENEKKERALFENSLKDGLANGM